MHSCIFRDTLTESRLGYKMIIGFFFADPKGGSAAMYLWIPALLGAANLAAFILMGVDKRRAIKGRWRIPERTLFLWAVFGGAWGAYAGMRIFRHKTRKPLFRFGYPVLCILETIVLIFLYVTGYLQLS